MSARTDVRPKALRAWWAAATCVVALAGVYVSLVPFEFDRVPPGVSYRDALASSLDMTWTARGNLLANAVMFLPFGFFGSATLMDVRWSRLRRAGGGAALLSVSLVLSLSIEAAQVFVPGRTPSIADVTFQTGGTVAGLVLWVVVGREVNAWFVQFLAGTRTALEVSLWVYAAAAFLILLQPFDVTVAPSALAEKLRSGGIVLDPRHSAAWSLGALPALLADFVLAMPIGLLAVIAGSAPGAGRRTSSALAGVLAFFAAGEIAQVFIRSRTADVADYAANAVGAIAGVLLARAFLAAEPAPQLASSPRGRAAIFGVALVGSVLFYTVYNLSPFDFHLSRALLAHRIGWLVDVPFSGYYQNPEFKALADLLTKIAVAMPIGVLFHLCVRPDRTPYHRLIAVAWLVTTTAYFAVIEVGQVFLPSRYPDGTDILVASGSVALGMMLAHRFTHAGTDERFTIPPRASGARR